MVCLQKKRLLQVLMLLVNLVIRKLTNLVKISLLTQLIQKRSGEELEVKISYSQSYPKSYNIKDDPSHVNRSEQKLMKEVIQEKDSNVNFNTDP